MQKKYSPFIRKLKTTNKDLYLLRESQKPN